MNKPEQKCGFVAIVGRPNVGKSTLTNKLAEEKIAIISSKPETTRKNIKAIINHNDSQIILIDTPGIHKPKTLLGKRLNQEAKAALQDADLILFLMPADQERGKGDEIIVQNIGNFAHKNTPVIAVLTKTDLIGGQKILERLVEIETMRDFDEIVPLSAISENDAKQLEILKDVIVSYLPAGPKLFPDEIISDETLDETISEIIREAALEGLFDELSHSLNVVITDLDEIEYKNGKMLEVHANLIIERDSQKGIIIGKGGERLKQIGQDARKEIEKLMDMKVLLKNKVVVAKNWQNDSKYLNKFGF